MRQQCREEVKLLVGKEVWEDVKRKLRRMRTEQGNSSAEDQTLKKRLRTKHDDVDRNTIQVAVLTASTAQIGPVIAAAVHNPATTVVTARAAQIQPTPTNDDIDSANNDTTNDSFNGFSRGAIAGSYGPQSYLNSPTPFPVLTPLTSTTSSPLPDSELTLVETAAAADVTQLPSLVNPVTPVVDCAPMHVSIAESPYVAESPASNNTASPQAAANYEHQPTEVAETKQAEVDRNSELNTGRQGSMRKEPESDADADCRRQCSRCKHFKPDDQFKTAKTCKVCSVRKAAAYKKRKPKTVKPHTVVGGPVVERARQVNVPRTTRTDPRLIECKKCNEFIRMSSAGYVTMHTKTRTETLHITAKCDKCTDSSGGKLFHSCWRVLDQSAPQTSLYHVQPNHYSMNHCRFVVDPANLGAIPNASRGSLNDGVLWPTGLQAAPGIPGVVKGVYCTDSIALGTTHCQNWHAAALARDNHLTIYEIKPAHPKHSQFLNTNTVGFFCCGEVVDVSPTAIALGHVAITHT